MSIRDLLTPLAETEPHVVNVLRECMNDLQNGWKLTGWPVIVVASTSDADRIPLGVLGCFKHDITFEVRYFAFVSCCRLFIV
jgi:hypothetical protein